MPRAIFDLPGGSGNGSFGARHLIPGVEPGGSRVGQPFKPALLIRDAWIEPLTLDIAAAGMDQLTVHLRLSQEQSLDPGLLLPIHSLGMRAITTTEDIVGIWDIPYGHKLAGTIWAASWVGIEIVVSVHLTVNVDVYLEYEVIDIPWVEWFVKWEFLDGLPTGATREF